MRSFKVILTLLCTICALSITAQTNSFYIGAKAGATSSEFKFTEDLTTDEVTKLSLKLQELIDTIEEKELRWMELVEKLES